MAFCRECGSEIAEGVKFCTNCGARVDVKATVNAYDMERRKKHKNYNEYGGHGRHRGEEKQPSLFDKLSRFFGIILLILVFIDFQSDPPILTIILSVIIIVGAIFCLAQKYKLKGFTIIAMLLAVFCLMSGISQGKRLGFTRIPGKSDYKEATKEISEAPDDSDNIIGGIKEVETKDRETATEEIEQSKNPDSTTDSDAKAVESSDSKSSNAETETTQGVNPELKAFLDSYEGFVDEYVAFMKEYTENPGNVASMLNQYTEIMKKYADFADAIDKYDSNDMSVEDAKYYLDVTNRCTQKMLDIY